MGKKSRSKKNRPQPKKQQSSAPLEVRTVTPESLKGGSVSSRNASTLDVQTDYIRSDIVRILLLLVVVALLIAVFYLVDMKTPYFDKVGNHLTSFLRLQ